jgi:hypothetical protein
MKSFRAQLTRTALAALAVTSLFFFVNLSGCKEEDNGEAVNYGPDISSDAVNSAINDPVASMDPTAIQIGQFVHTVVTQQIAGTVAPTLMSETGITVTDREQDTEKVIYTIHEDDITYGTAGASTTSSKQYNECANLPTISYDACSGQTAPTPSPTPSGPATPTPAPGSPTPTPSPTPAISSDGALGGPIAIFTTADVLAWAKNAPDEVLRATVHSLDTSTATYHNLVISTSMVAPPASVQTRTNCVGLTNCLIQVTTVDFDQVTNDGTSDDRSHFTFQLSPTVPYFARQLNECVTAMIDAGDGINKVLVTQCKPVIDFTFNATQ